MDAKGFEDIIRRASLRHGVALMFHLLFGFAFCVNKWAIWSSRGSNVSLEKRKLQLGFRYKSILSCCISLAVFYTFIGICNPLYWWLKDLPSDYGAEADYVVQGMSFYMMAYYAHQSATEGRRDKFPLLLRMWWVLSFILFASFSFFNLWLFMEKNVMGPCIWFDLLGLTICSILCYAGYYGRIGVISFTEPIQEPLLNGSSQKSRGFQVVTPYATAGILSRLSFSWMSTLFSVGFKKPLKIDDVPQVAEMDNAEEVYNVFRSRLEAEGLLNTKAMAKATLLSVWKEVIMTTLLLAIVSSASYAGPYLIDTFVRYLDGDRQFPYQGYILAFTFVIALLVQSLAQRHYYFKTQQIGLHFEVAFMAAIYRKGLRLSSQSRQKHTSGEIINYMTVDADRLGDFSWYMNEF